MVTLNGNKKGRVALQSPPNNIIGLLTAPLGLSPDARLQSIGGGAVNNVYKLIDGDRCYAVKWIGDDSFSGINRIHQYALQEQLASRGLAPDPIWLDEEGRLWVESWHDSPRMQSEIDIELLATCLAHIHAQPITGRTLDLSERWQHYCEFAQLERADELFSIIAEYRPTLSLLLNQDLDICLCHNDLSFGHILSSSPFIVVDWEYAAMGNRYFDIVACCLINELNPAQVETLEVAYAKLVGIPEQKVRQGTNAFQPIVELTYTLWAKALEANNRVEKAQDSNENESIG